MPDRRRRWLWRAGVLLAAWIALTGLVVAAGTGVEHSSAVTAFDRHVTSIVVAHRTSALDAVMRAVTWLGSWVALAVVGAAIVLLTVRRRLPVLALVLAVLAWGGESAGVAIAKHLVARPRPPEALWLVHAHGWSWPSGHAAVAVVVFGTAAAVATLVTTSRPARVGAWTIAAIAVALVAYSRVELGVHWLTDVIAGVAFASAWLVVVALVCRWKAVGRGAPVR